VAGNKRVLDRLAQAKFDECQSRTLLSLRYVKLRALDRGSTMQSLLLS